MLELPYPELATMPRGGFDASWLDRRLETDRAEFTDRDDVPDSRKQNVITALDVLGERMNQHAELAQVALNVVTDIAHPRILELGAGHGRLTEQLVALNPRATVTVSDLDPVSVDNMARRFAPIQPGVRAEVIDATAIDKPDDSYDLVVFAQAFHHLPPSLAYAAIAEATRVGRKFLVLDLKRQRPLMILAAPLLMPILALLWTPWKTVPAAVHDGLISGLRAYSPSALASLGHAVDPRMSVEFLTPPGRSATMLTAVTFSRPVDAGLD